MEGTCEWVFKHLTYTEWESQAESDAGAKFLWIHGPAGFGKTILSASLIKHFNEMLKLPVAFCFSSSHARRTVDLDGIVRTWITQLAQFSIEVLNVCQTMHRKQGARRASRSDVWKLLREVSAQIPCCILALDGLDEFPIVDGARCRFLAELKQAVASTRVKVVITSRNEVDIASEVSASATRSTKHLMLEIQITKEQVNGDVHLYSQSAVAQKFPKQGESFLQEISTQMAENSGGMFLWIKLQQSQLRGSQNKKTVQRIVQGMPQGLYQTYARDWEGIQELDTPDRNRAIDILRWLTFGYRALTVDEMAEALIIELDTECEAFCADDLPEETDAEYSNNEIKGLCRSLVEIRLEDGDPDSPTNTVHLVHASVREYLITVLPVPNSFVSDRILRTHPTMHHAMLAGYCLRYLDCRHAWEKNGRGGSRSFLAYAVHLWVRHLHDSEGYHDYPIDIACNFMNSKIPNFVTWRSRFELAALVEPESTNPGPSVNPSAMYYASLFGLIPVMDFLHSNEDEDIDSVGGLLGTALQATCLQGNDIAFDQLMAWGADITIQGGQFNTAINAAAFNGRYRMVKRLLDRDLQTDLLKTQIWEAMRTTAREGHVEVIRLFLESSLVTTEEEEKNLDSSEVLSDSLLIAAGYGHTTIVKLVLEHGADIAARTEFNDTALHVAAIFNHVEVAKILIQEGASIDCTGALGSPMHSAADNGCLDMVIELKERGASLDLRGKAGASPLFRAAFNGFADVVTTLLAHGADVDAQTNLGHTALYMAIEERHQQVVDILLDHGANVNIGPEGGWKPLHIAVESGIVDIIPRLIKRGADVDSQSDGGRTALHLTVIFDQKAALGVLLRFGAKFMPDKDGWTPLMLAVEKLDLDLTTLLFRAGAELDCHPKLGATPLHIAICSQNGEQDQKRLDVVKFLLEHGAVCRADVDGWTPLHLAAEFGHDVIVTLLLDQGHDVNAQICDGETPLWCATFKGKRDIVQQLLDRGADADLVRNDGVSPLYIALEHRDPALVRSLLASGCDTNLRDSNGDTPLRKAIEHGSDELIEDLLGRGADLSAMDDLGMTCLDWLKRLRPESKILTHEHSNADVGPDVTILSHTMCELALRFRHAEKDRKSDLYRLFRGLLMLDMEDDAKLAFQAYLLAEDSSDRTGICCNTCDNVQTREDPFYTCKTCPDSDFCHECMSKHEKQPMLDLCRDHEFLRIVVADAKIRPDQTEAFDEWLLSIQERLQPLNGSQEIEDMARLTIDETAKT